MNFLETLRNIVETKVLILEDYKKSGKISGADLEKIRKAAEILRAGGLVAFPTETVYGLGGDARRADVSARIYAAKGRPSDNPLIVHISCMEELEPLVRKIPESCRKLAASYWPGPMTLVLPKSELIPAETTGGLETVAVRMPVHPVANKLIELAQVPVAAPSANRSGRPSTTTAEHCVEDLDGRIDLILDGGPCDIGVESTIVDLTEAEPVLLRPGAVTMEMLADTLGKEPLKDKALVRALKEGEKPKAPGMKYRHYAPKAPLVVVRARSENEASDRENATETEETAAEIAKTAEISGLVPTAAACRPGKELPEEERLGKEVSERELTGKEMQNVKVYRCIAELAGEYLAQGLKTEILCTEECAEWIRKESVETEADLQELCSRITESVPLRTFGSAEDSLKISQNLFAVLRDTDEDTADRLIAEGFGENDLFLAIMNRLKKAAGWQLREV